MKNKLFQNGFETVPYSKKLLNVVTDARETWIPFYEQDLSIKTQFPFKDGTGYEYSGEDRRDFKELFHVSLGYVPGLLNPVCKRFIDSSKEVISESVETVKEIAATISEQTGFNFVKLLGDPFLWRQRFLHYPPTKRKIVGVEHIDKGGFTLHLNESGGGLQYFWKNKWSDMKFTHKQAAYFPGALGQYHSKCQIKALSHRVVSTRESREIGRTSSVLFIDCNDKMKYNKTKFSSTQAAFKPGQNYYLSSQEFSSYFIDREVVD